MTEADEKIAAICSLNSDIFRKENISLLPYAENEEYKTSLQSLGNVVFGSYLGLELGCPPSRALSYVFSCTDLSLPGTVLFCGNETFEQGTNMSFIQLLFLRNRNCDSSLLLRKRSLTGEIPGYMGRSRGTETAVKIHKTLIEQGFSLRNIAAAIVTYFQKEGYSQEDMQLVIGAGSDAAINLFNSLVQEYAAQIETAQKNDFKKIMEECTKETNCFICDDKPVCDTIRSIIK